MEEEFQGSKVLRRGSGAGGMWGWGLGIVERRRFGSGVVCLGRARVGEARQVLAVPWQTETDPVKKTSGGWRVASWKLAASVRVRCPILHEDDTGGQCRILFQTR